MWHSETYPLWTVRNIFKAQQIWSYMCALENLNIDNLNNSRARRVLLVGVLRGLL